MAVYSDPWIVRHRLATPSIVVLGRSKILGSGKVTDELIWFMDQYGDVLRTDPELLSTILEQDQQIR
jgi:hypothetical protein